MTSRDISVKRIYRWLKSTWKDVQHQRNTNENLNELIQKGQKKAVTTLSAREDVETLDHSYITGRNVK